MIISYHISTLILKEEGESVVVVAQACASGSHPIRELDSATAQRVMENLGKRLLDEISDTK